MAVSPSSRSACQTVVIAGRRLLQRLTIARQGRTSLEVAVLTTRHNSKTIIMPIGLVTRAVKGIILIRTLKILPITMCHLDRPESIKARSTTMGCRGRSMARLAVDLKVTTAKCSSQTSHLRDQRLVAMIVMIASIRLMPWPSVTPRLKTKGKSRMKVGMNLPLAYRTTH